MVFNVLSFKEAREMHYEELLEANKAIDIFHPYIGGEE